MKAVVLEETRQIVVREVPDAEMKETTDVLLRITSTAICGTDLHFYEGRMRGIEGGVIGHEPLGVVEEVGSTVKNVKKGDRWTERALHLFILAPEESSRKPVTANDSAAPPDRSRGPACVRSRRKSSRDAPS